MSSSVWCSEFHSNIRSEITCDPSVTDPVLQQSCVDTICYSWKHSLSCGNHGSDEVEYETLTFFLICFSIFFDVIFALAIWCNKGLQEHPMKLLQMTVLVSAAYQWYHLIMPFACEIYLPQILQYTLFQSVELYEIMPIMEEISFFFQTFLFNLGLMLNICIAWDLYLIIRFPFQSPESRYFKYYMLSIFVSLIPATVRLMTLHTDEYMAYSYLNLGIMIAYASIGMFSSIYAFYMLSGPGVST